MDIMYSPSEKQQNDIVRLGLNKKKHIIKGRRIIKPYVSLFDSK